MIDIPQMPLYWRFKDHVDDDPRGLPARFPFSFDYQPELDLFIEKRSPELSRLLKGVYAQDSNVGYLQDGHGLIQTYGKDFWAYLNRLVETTAGLSVLEIGCGGCVFLERLRDAGCNVLGVDPSPFAKMAGERKGIEVIQDYFPVNASLPRQDLIFQVDVLEHVENPTEFLAMQREYLNDDGLVVVNVPDCGESIDRGDISMALHQHVNMFDEASLMRVFNAAGLEVVRLEKSQYGSALFCSGRKAKGELVRPSDNAERWNVFQQQAEQTIRRFETLVGQAREQGSVGFFMPQRAFPYLGIYGWLDGFRLFDNMNVWHRRYLDGFDQPIENQQDLINEPVDHLFIMSLSFGQVIQDAVGPQLPHMRITTLDEILASR